MKPGHYAVLKGVEAAKPVIEGWTVPVDLPSELPPVHPFSAELLPAAFRPWVMDIASRMQCAPDFVAVTVLAGISALIGAKSVIKPKERDDWAVVPNLWAMAIGRSATMKTPTMNAALRPINLIEAREREAYEGLKSQHDIDVKVADMAGDANNKEARGIAAKNPEKARELLKPVEVPPAPVEPRRIVNDSTVEKLGEVLKDNPWGVLAYRDELYGLLKSMDREGQEGARAFYLQGYDGNGGYTFDRIGRGTIRIPRVCISMVGGIQPGRIQSYVRDAVSGGSGDDGLLQRFGLAVWPDMSSDFINVDQWPDSVAQQAAYDVFDRMAAIQPAGDEPGVWRFDSAAQSIFNEWREPFEQEIRGDSLHPALVSHLAKYRKLVPALALIFALVDGQEGNAVGKAHIVRALAWSEYLRSHAERLYSAAVMPETGAARTLLAKIRSGALGASFTTREASRRHWSGLTTSDAVRNAAELLVDYEWLRHEIVPTGGRPTDRYDVNPYAMGAA